LVKTPGYDCPEGIPWGLPGTVCPRGYTTTMAPRGADVAISPAL